MDKPQEKKVLGILAIVFGGIGLVFSWVPIVNNVAAFFGIVGLILGIIALVINRKAKKMLALIGTILSAASIIIVLATQAMYSKALDDASDSFSKATVSNTSSSSSSSSNNGKTIEVNYDKYDVKSSKTYKVDFSNDEWAGTNIKIDSVKVYKLAKTYKYDSANDGNFDVNGFVQVHMSVSPTRDIQAYPTQGTMIYSNGEQHGADSSESWDGDIANGATKTGTITVPVSSLDKVDSLSSIRFKFDAYYDTDDYEDDNANHTYDLTLNLN